MKYIKTGLKPQMNEMEARAHHQRQQLLHAQGHNARPQPPPGSAPSGQPSEKYFGEVATGYDAKREDQPKWTIEQQIIERMLSDFPAGSWVLDAPCGTGRFFPLYEAKGFVVRGVDISPDMLQMAGAKIKDPVRIVDGEKAWGWRVANLVEQGSGLPDDSVDCAVSVRFTRWVMGQYGPEGIKAFLGELQRVSRGKVIFTARVRNHHCEISYDLIKESLHSGWDIHEDAKGFEEDYRILALGPAA